MRKLAVLREEPIVLLRRVARPLLAAVFVADGVNTLLSPKPKIEAATPLLAKGQEMVPAIPSVNPALVVQAGAGAKILGGLMMGFGRAPRIAALVLAADLVPSTVMQHSFWSTGYPDERKNHAEHFLKNAGLLAGLLLTISGGKATRRSKKSSRRGRKRS
ncbi:MAG TPA: DoxX family protein [Pseudonocardiaceae bacterium]